MDVSATYKGQDVRILDVIGDGATIWTTYVDGSGTLYVDKQLLPAATTSATMPHTVGTSATVN